MAVEGSAAVRSDAPDPNDPRKPRRWYQLNRVGWRSALRRAGAEFLRDECTDMAAALTYYGVLALFPALLAVVSLLGVLGQAGSTVPVLLQVLHAIAPADISQILEGLLLSLVQSQFSGWTLLAGLLGAVWSGSAYVGAFARMMNRIYATDEGRPLILLKLQQLAITVVVLVLVAVLLIGLVVSGPIAERVTWLLGLGILGRQMFNLVKWPLLLVVAVVLIAVLYYCTPNVRQPKFRWLSLGAGIALGSWLLVSAGFGMYVANFSSYNKMYGTLGGIIVFLLWIWLSNCALVFGAEFDSELERSRQLQAGLHAERTLQLPPRDVRASTENRRMVERRVARARRIREQAAAERADEVTPDDS